MEKPDQESDALKAANVKVGEAIREWLAQSCADDAVGVNDGPGSDPGLITEWIVIGTSTVIESDGFPATRTFFFDRDDEVSLSRLIGLVQYSMWRLQKRVMTEEDE